MLSVLFCYVSLINKNLIPSSLSLFFIPYLIIYVFRFTCSGFENSPFCSDILE